MLNTIVKRYANWSFSAEDKKIQYNTPTSKLIQAKKNSKEVPLLITIEKTHCILSILCGLPNVGKN